MDEGTNTEKSAFFAFASRPKGIPEQVSAAIEKYRRVNNAYQIKPWTELNVSGKLIWKEILREIDKHEFFLADVSVLNPNVTYEIGYAIGRRKKIRFVHNKDFLDSIDRSRVGIYDVLGYSEYRSSDELFEFLCSGVVQASEHHIDEGFDKAPIFLMDAFEKSDLINHIKTCVKKRLVRFRSFDPQEQARLPVDRAIREVALSEGVIVSRVPTNYPDSEMHNLRSAFVAGLAHGMDKLLSIIQVGDTPAPLDFRDSTDVCYTKEQIEVAIDRFSLSVTPRLQQRVHPAHREGRSLLERINLGGSVAENELQTIDEYYHDTDAFLRTSRGEVRLIIGRKGSGKTALFLRVRNEKRDFRQNIVVDLKPEGYKLLKFKERIVDALSVGSLEHVITAIWEYVILLEVALKILENDRNLYARNAKLTDKYIALREVYEHDNYYSEGDFSERVSILLEEISEKIEREKLTDSVAILSQRQVSEIIYKHQIGQLRDAVAGYISEKNETWVLIDNLDKGWPSAGVSRGDVVLISCLIDSLEKISRSFRQKRYDRFYSTVFLRGDVYENLVDVSSDRGKIIPVSVDWSDPEALYELLRKRFVYSGFDDQVDLEDIWQQVSAPLIDNQSSLAFMVERTLYRPRALLDLIYMCKSISINRRHQKIDQEDLREAARRFSISLIDNISLELRDINPKYDRLLYEFVDREPTLSRASLRKIIQKFIKDSTIDEEEGEVIKLLLWFGFFGIQNENGAATYIFDMAYNMNMMRALSDRSGVGRHFVIHPAFRFGLSVSEARASPQIRLL